MNSRAGNGSYDEILWEGYSTNPSLASTNNLVVGNTFDFGTGAVKARHAISEASSGDGGNNYGPNTYRGAGTASLVNVQSNSTVFNEPTIGFGTGSNHFRTVVNGLTALEVDEYRVDIKVLLNMPLQAPPASNANGAPGDTIAGTDGNFYLCMANGGTNAWRKIAGVSY